MHRHISEQYELELSQIRDSLMEMGGLVEQQVINACTALIEHDGERAELVRDMESRLNQFEIELDDQCISIIAKRQPTAGDLRRVVSVMKVITDLERIGDEADRVAKMAIRLARTEMPGNQYADFRDMHKDVLRMLNRALDSFARLDTESAIRVIRSDEDIDEAYSALIRNCIREMRDNPDEVEGTVSVMWAGRALERIGDHAKNIAEYVIYQVKGVDVRHGSDVAADGTEPDSD